MYSYILIHTTLNHTKLTDECKYGDAINQPQCDDPIPLLIVVVPQILVHLRIALTINTIMLTDEGKYGDINQPKS